MNQTDEPGREKWRFSKDDLKQVGLRLVLLLALLIVGGCLGLAFGYQTGGIIYDWFPYYFDQTYSKQFPHQAISKIRSCAIIDVTLFSGATGLAVFGIFGSIMLFRKRPYRSPLTE